VIRRVHPPVTDHGPRNRHRSMPVVATAAIPSRYGRPIVGQAGLRIASSITATERKNLAPARGSGRRDGTAAQASPIGSAGGSEKIKRPGGPEIPGQADR
jgi:hypothetical protein